MGNLRSINSRNTDGRDNDPQSSDGPSADRRRVARSAADLELMVWGVDTKGERFLQEARARDISLRGALLSGFSAELRSGDVIGILYAARKARYRVVWVRYDETGDKMKVAVHRLTADECPWLAVLDEETATSDTKPQAEAGH